MVGVDVGFENPLFACLEIDYEDADNDPTGEAALKTHQTLTFYEMNLGLNHVVRKYSEPLEEHANFLISVPGDKDGPSGVLICSENYLTYKNLGDQHDIRCPIPRRRVSYFYSLIFPYHIGIYYSETKHLYNLKTLFYLKFMNQD